MSILFGEIFGLLCGPWKPSSFSSRILTIKDYIMNNLTELQKKYLELKVIYGLNQGEIASKMFNKHKTPYKEVFFIKNSIGGIKQLSKNHDFYKLNNKIIDFKLRKNSNGYPLKDFDFSDIRAKFGDLSCCPLSGQLLDLKKCNFSLDHIIPVALGGTNELDNLQLLGGPINMFKSIYSVDETIKIARIISKYQSKILEPDYSI